MKTLILSLILTVFTLGGMAPIALAADQPAAAPRTIKGDVLTIEGEFYVVKDVAGKEVRLHVNKDTKREGAIKVGDKIEAQATAEGHATSIKSAAR